ncbi:hypothetical protein [Curtobacterium sp. MCJR17_020]|uniref:hypothetical protein n=1 Tax=Curtobacterium sp. MCJR17_020 TaxID=2175619 RepID=UPI0011B68452|nr:hypothetical protein [Curtobacterium sp. MCJR17_020]WIE70802.1 hypothetical protein DEJ14_011345 [Curtobacterium sp. MCJR17_020]
MTDSKVCPGCNELKSLDEYPLDAMTRNGHTSRCAVCVRARVRDYRKTPAGRKARREQMARYRQRNKARNLTLREQANSPS